MPRPLWWKRSEKPAVRPSPGHPQILVRGPCQEPGKVPHGLCPSTGFPGLAVSAGPPHRGPHLEGGEPHKPIQAVVVRGDEAWPPLQVTGLALELVVLPLGVWRAGIGAGGALQDDLRAFLGDAGCGGDQSGLHLPTLTPTPDLTRRGRGWGAAGQGWPHPHISPLGSWWPRGTCQRPHMC